MRNDKTAEAIKEYYYMNVKCIKDSKLPNFLKLKFLTSLGMEFISDKLAEIRLPKEEYINIANTIQTSKELLKARQIHLFSMLKEKAR